MRAEDGSLPPGRCAPFGPRSGRAHRDASLRLTICRTRSQRRRARSARRLAGTRTSSRTPSRRTALDRSGCAHSRPKGCGADVVSGGELRVALGCGVSPEAIVFSGVAKTDDEIDRALAAGVRGILAIQAESIEELVRIDARARASARRARVAIRVNPGVEKGALETHARPVRSPPGTTRRSSASRAGNVPAGALCRREREARRSRRRGRARTWGRSSLTTDAYGAAARVVFEVAWVARESGARLRFVDTGGGFGIDSRRRVRGAAR